MRYDGRWRHHEQPVARRRPRPRCGDVRAVDEIGVERRVYVRAGHPRRGPLQSKCAECHGDDFEGREHAPALAGGAFGQRWDGATLRKLFERLEEMPPDDPAARLAPKQYADILAFLLSVNNIPAGTTALVADKDALAAIKYNSQRPK